MAKSRGLKLPIKYFLENHLFDIINRTDTHRWLPKEYYKENLNNIDHGVLYMSSWTSILKKSTLIGMQILENVNTCYDVLDVGSGKGKALLVWSKLKFPKDTLIYGIEYNKDLAKISKAQINVSITGIAGPSGGTRKKPVGLVYVGIKKGNKIKIHKHLFKNRGRSYIQKATVNKALKLTHNFL